MDRSVVLLVVLTCLFAHGRLCDSGTTDHLPLQMSKNESQSDLTVGVKPIGGNKGAGEARQGEINKNPLEKEAPPDNGEGKPVRKTVPEEAKTSDQEMFKNIPKENGHGEKCDTSSLNTCSVDKNQLIACLRVPGNDSPTLSLLLQNKGTSSVSIIISASNFVKLEKSTVMLPPNKDEKVQISVEEGVGNDPILLTIGKWTCNLSFWEMIPDSIKKSAPSADEVHFYSTISISIIYSLLGLVVVVGVAYMVVRLRQQHIKERTLGYQMLDAALPVSTGGMKERNLVDGWDDSWSDNWDDEEAPMTPSTASMNLSSKGLSSRRMSKEGWKN